MTDGTLRLSNRNVPFVSSIGLSFSRLLTYLKINPERAAANVTDNFKILSSGPQKHLLILVYIHTHYSPVALIDYAIAAKITWYKYIDFELEVN